MSNNRYDPVVMSLHWLIAIMVVGAYAVGLVREDLPKNEFRAFLLHLHMWIGQAVVFLTVARLARRAVTSAPAPTVNAMTARLARLGHAALYVALFVIPALGLAAAAFKGRDITLFGLAPLPKLVGVDKAFAESLEGVHAVAAHALLALAFGHAAAAIFHHVVLKDGVLARMLPARRSVAAE